MPCTGLGRIERWSDDRRFVTLGRSPGAVTGLYQTLLEETVYRPAEMHILMTNDFAVSKAASLVETSIGHKFGEGAPAFEWHQFDEQDM